MKMIQSTLMAATLFLGLATTFAAAQGEHPGVPPKPEELAEKLIAGHDGDGDGKLSVSELSTALSKLPPPPHPGCSMPPRRPSSDEGQGGPGRGRPDGKQPPNPERDAAEMIRLGDANGDGVLDQKELTEGLRRFHEMHHGGKVPGGAPPPEQSPSGTTNSTNDPHSTTSHQP